MAISKSTLCADEMVEAEGATFFRSTTRQDVRATATSRRRNVAPRINVNLPYSSMLLQIYGREPTIKHSQGHFWLIVRSLQGPVRYKESRFFVGYSQGAPHGRWLRTSTLSQTSLRRLSRR